MYTCFLPKESADRLQQVPVTLNKDQQVKVIDTAGVGLPFDGSYRAVATIYLLGSKSFKRVLVLFIRLV